MEHPGFYLKQRHSFTLDPAFHAGTYYAQEASSMFVETAIRQTVDLNKRLIALDLCAAPGGKSTHLLSLLNDKSLLVSNEVIRSRTSILKENMTKWGYPNVVITNNDPANFNGLPNFFDIVLVDAPCSGEGLFRKDPESVAHWSLENVRLCALRQQRIIENIWPSLKPGGILIYSTCTYNEDENENNLLNFANERDPEFLELSLHDGWGMDKVTKDSVIGYRFFPHKIKGEGFFISVCRKKVSENDPMLKPTGKNSFSSIVPGVAKDWVLNPEEKLFRQHNDSLLFIPIEFRNEVEILLRHLKMISAGTKIGTIKKSKVIPDHALALSTEINEDAFNTLDLDLEQALSYLRKESFPINSTKAGIHLVRYHENPIGWANVLPNRINNLYPTDWRIRMR
ncbi:MAG: rRNA methyltransferase [Flammeovirgaceae bacterium]|nr:rRNA methyltransferase [Flammeovirgaceae bacterium]